MSDQPARDLAAELGIEEIDLSTLKQDPNNANDGTSRGDAALGFSLRSFGAAAAAVTDRNGTILVGNKRTRKAIELGMKDAIRIKSDGSKMIIIERTDIDADADPLRAQELAVADNRTAELDLKWNGKQLRKDLDAGAQFALFEDPEIAEVMDGGDEAAAAQGDEAAAAKPAKRTPTIKPIPLYLTADAIEPFKEKTEALAAAMDLHNTTDVILWALNYAHAAWKSDQDAAAAAHVDAAVAAERTAEPSE